MNTKTTIEKIKLLPSWAKFAILTLLVSVSIGVAMFVQNETPKGNSAIISLVSPIEIATAGEDGMSVDLALNSWPGELVFPGLVKIQPSKEGVVLSWRVNIGDRVSAGQTLADVSAPPETPELAAMLAERAEMLSSAKGRLSAAEDYAIRTGEQVIALQSALSGGSTNKNIIVTSLRDALIIREQFLLSFVKQAFTRQLQSFSNVSDSKFFNYGSFNKNYGTLNQSLQNGYVIAAIALAEALKENPSLMPDDAARKYFTVATLLSNATPKGEIIDMRVETSEDQEKLLDLLKGYADAKAEIAMKEAEFSLTVSEKISDSSRELANIRSQVAAAEAAYNAIVGSISGFGRITSPRGGIVSSILAKEGSFVRPGEFIATVVSENAAAPFVRFQIPATAVLPKRGDELSFVRPGFATDVRKGRLIGIGGALDEMGSFMADGSLAKSLGWPSDSAVRVFISSTSSKASIAIPMKSIWWKEEGVSAIWMVSKEGRVYGQTVVLGRTGGGVVEVLVGLARGERYLPNPPASVMEGMQIEALVTEEEKRSAGDMKINKKVEEDSHVDHDH